MNILISSTSNDPLSKQLFRFLLLVVFITFSYSTTAQYGTIKGKVWDSKTLQPLPLAAVYINLTTVGTRSNDDGEFKLDKVPIGENELVVSYAGYQVYQTRISISDSTSIFLDIKLSAQVLKEITVTSKKDDVWKKQLNKFSSLFFGINDNTKQCKLLNPWVLEFADVENGGLKAEASAPLLIENLSLGYNISYQLKKFEVGATTYSISGVTWFQEIPTDDPTLKKVWINNRKNAYLGSPRHLFKAITENRVSQEGFDLYEDISNLPDVNRVSTFLVNMNKSIVPYSTNGKAITLNHLAMIQLPERIEVHYLKKKAIPRIYRSLPVPISWIESKKSLLINEQGIPLNASAVTVSGAMSEARISELLPNDFEPIVDNQPTTERIKKSKGKLSYLLEKPYLQTDKSCYYSDETCWFKAYVNYYSPAYKDSLSKVLYIDFVDVNQKIVSTKMFPIDSGTSVGSIPLRSLLPGDYQMRAYTRWMLNFDKSFTFSKPIKILADDEDVLMNNPANSEETGNLDLEINRSELLPDDTVKIDITALDAYGYPVPAIISLSISDGKYQPKTTEQTIFKKFPIDESLAIDSLANGVLYAIQNGIDIKGRFVTKSNKATQATLTFVQQNSDDQFKIVTDNDGSFHISGLQLFDSAKLLVQGLSVKGKKKGKILLDSSRLYAPIEAFEALDLGTIKVKDVRVSNDLNTPLASVLLEEVTVRDAKPKEIRGSSAHLMDDQIISGDAFTSVENGDLLSILQTKISGLRVVAFFDGNMARKILKFGGVSSFDTSPVNQEPVVMVDGRILLTSIEDETAAEQIARMSANSIDHIEVIKYGGGAAYGVRGANGVISIYTNYLPNTKPKESPDQSKFQPIHIPGFASNKQFNVSKSSSKNPNSTIYWNPSINTSREKSVKISLVAPSSTGVYQVTAEGVTYDGKPVRAVKMFSIIERH